MGPMVNIVAGFAEISRGSYSGLLSMYFGLSVVIEREDYGQKQLTFTQNCKSSLHTLVRRFIPTQSTDLYLVCAQVYTQ